MRDTRALVRFAAVGAAVAILAACGGDSDNDKTAAPTETTAPEAAAAALIIQADLVAGPKNMPAEAKATSACVLQSRYARNSQVVWRVRVMDGADGSQLDDSALDEVVVKLADGQTFPMKFGDHPKDNPTDAFWATSWTVPTDYATGTVSFTITATSKDGATAEFEPFNVAPSLLTITDEVLATIEA